MQVCGTPNADLLDKISVHARNYVTQLEVQQRQDFNVVFRGCSAQAIDLLEKMLELDADLRITSTDALAHPYFEEYHDPEDEPTGKEYVCNLFNNKIFFTTENNDKKMIRNDKPYVTD